MGWWWVSLKSGAIEVAEVAENPVYDAQLVSSVSGIGSELATTLPRPCGRASGIVFSTTTS